MSEKQQLLDVIMRVVDDSLANLHTATIARITAVQEKTVSCKPVISRVLNGQKIDLPEFIDVPPFFMQGGGSYTAYPIAAGDYALLIFTERCFDNWYAGRDNQVPLQYRMHDYSDGFALVGVNPLSGALTIPDKIKQVGDTVQEGNYEHTGDRTQAGDFSLTGNFTVNGDGGGLVNMSNTILNLTNGDIIVDGVSLKTHTHGGVQTGGGNTGQPNT